MRNIRTILDLEKYLKSKHLLWTGEVYDKTQQKFKRAEPKDFEQNKLILLKLEDDYIYFDFEKENLVFCFSPHEISTFIAEHLNYYWDTKVIDSNYVSRKATAADFLPQKRIGGFSRKIALPVIDIKHSKPAISLNVEISNSNFMLETFENIHDTPYFVHYADSWQKFLFKNSPEMYGPIYIDILRKQCKEIEEKAVTKKTLFGKKTYLSSHDSSHLEKLKKNLARAINVYKDHNTLDNLY